MSLISSLRNSAEALQVFEKSMSVVQNNVANVGTPGYAKQRLNLNAQAFDLRNGLSGGVAAGSLQTIRSQYAELSVRNSSGALGKSDQKTTSLGALESSFDISGTSGIPAGLNQLYKSFSAWSLSPNNPGARQQVLSDAETLAGNFQTTAQQLSTASQLADQDLSVTADQINYLGAKIRDYNVNRRQSPQGDAGSDAELYQNLEALSELADFTALHQPDGSVTVLLGGQTTLVNGEHLRKIGIASEHAAAPPPTYPNNTPPAQIVDAEGTDITANIRQGKLAGLIEFRNGTLAHLQGDGQQQGEINRLAQSFADRVNDLLTSGLTTEGPPAQNGIALFTYDPDGPARSLQVNPAITPADLAAIEVGATNVANGTALKLAGLANPQDAAGKIDELSYVGYFGKLAGKVGRELAEAKSAKSTQTQLVAQAHDFREEASGVSLDEEAIHLVEFQRAYEASAQMLKVISELTETVINLLR